MTVKINYLSSCIICYILGEMSIIAVEYMLYAIGLN
jgi:hypothetical protein